MLELQAKSKLFQRNREYKQVFSDLVNKFTNGDISLDQKSIRSYWILGKAIVELQELLGWGAQVVENLMQDLTACFPDVKGFSNRNMLHMRAFYIAYRNIIQHEEHIETFPMFLIPWMHNVLIFEKVKEPSLCIWYAQKTYEENWSRSTLAQHISSLLYQHEGSALSNFDRTLSVHDAKIVNRVIKDPYIFTFAEIEEGARERDVEKRLLHCLRDFLSELGEGFTLYGHQYHLSVGKESYYIDLLFYHIELRRFIVVELKSKGFVARDIGQIGFYLAGVDNTVKRPTDLPTIGLLLCRDRNEQTVKHALQYCNAPIGVARYVVTQKELRKLKNETPLREDQKSC